MRKVSFVSLFCLNILVFSGCQGKQQPNESELNVHLMQFTTMFGEKGNLQQVASIMKFSGIEYTPQLTLDTTIKTNYTATPQYAALMCGVYSADALYHAAFSNSDEAFESYTSAQVLANQVGFGPFYVENLLRRREDGVTEADSLLFKMDDFLAEFDSSRTEEERFVIIAAYLMGNLIEKMYLIDAGLAGFEGVKISEISDEAKFVYRIFSSGGDAILYLTELTRKYGHNPVLTIELAKLAELFLTFKNSAQPSYSPDDVFIPSAELKALSDQIKRLREYIIAGNE